MTTAHFNVSYTDQIIYDEETEFFLIIYLFPSCFVLYCSVKNVLLPPHANTGAVGLPEVTL